MIAFIVDGELALGVDPKTQLKMEMGKFLLPLSMPKVGDVFDIGFYRPEAPIAADSPDNEVVGRLQFGDKCETFVTDISYWNITQYTKQWREGLQRLVDGAQSSCLIVSVVDPSDNAKGLVDWWCMYRKGDEVRVISQLNALPLPQGSFDITDPYKHVEAYSNSGEYEWVTSIHAIETFLNKIKSK